MSNGKMIKKEPVSEVDGDLVYCTAATEMDDDWLRALRLQEAASGGDKAAAAELEAMKKTPMYCITDEFSGQGTNKE
jgi:hypothetical protein